VSEIRSVVSTASPIDEVGPTAFNTGTWPRSLVTPRVRILTDNDYCGDPDGLVQLAHLLLTPSADVVGVIGSQLRSGDPWNPSGFLADRSVEVARDVAKRCNRSKVRLVPGSNFALAQSNEPQRCAGVELIIAEAMRTDTDLPLFITCGGGLTAIASAWLLEPRIADRCTVIWIGGHEHDGIAEPPEPGMDLEYNTGIDLIAAQVVFNDSNLNIWQVPRDAYRQVIASRAELIVRLRSTSPLGEFLFDALGSVIARVHEMGRSMGETYVLGDSPLVSLPTLQTAFELGPASNEWVTVPCPQISNSGLYENRSEGRPLRVFTRLDTRLLLEDLYAKLTLFGADASSTAPSDLGSHSEIRRVGGDK
jgi:purine nucleosidase